MRIPAATYRLQFNSSFIFDDAAALVDYLNRLGVSDCYASPIFQAGPGSTHGYDVCRFDAVSPAPGGEAGLRKFSATLHAAKMGLLVDMVPNHMGNDLSNSWWLDVLAHGTASRYANWFDIDWSTSHPSHVPQVVLPILEDRYGTVLEAGKLRLIRANGRLAFAYYDKLFPLSRDTTNEILAKAEGNTERLESALRQLNGVPGDPRSFDQLDHIIRRQHYRLAYWRVGPQEINYRRFFVITELVSMKMELEEVFQGTHKLIFDLLEQDVVTGIRIDHPDGLWNPKEYFDRLQSRKPVYVVAEKILTDSEPLPKDWAVQGTTGYDFLNLLNGLFVNQAAKEELSRTYAEFAGVHADSFQLIVFACKRLVLECSFVREVNVLAAGLKSLALRTRAGIDFTYGELHRAISDLAVCFPVYRTYITEQTTTPSEADRAVIERALSSALGGRQGDRAALEFTASLLVLEMPGDFDEAARSDAIRFVMKFQQLTGPLMAKGLEDTAFYRFNRLLSLNEVGGEPDRFGMSVSEFHRRNLERRENWPHTLLATATHDTKRGEDLRARLNVLSELPQRWHEALARWRELSERHKRLTRAYVTAPDANDEYFIYQTVLGAWHPEQTEPTAEFVERVSNATKKSLKEAKRHTSWTDPNKDYEHATLQYVRHILRRGKENAFLREFIEFLRPVAFHGFVNSLSQLVLKMSAPGIPDFYQGTEFWDYNLVDPDNRRPVDFKVRMRALAQLENNWTAQRSKLPKELLATWRDGRVKLFTTWRFLKFRAANQTLFDKGKYLPLEVHGKRANHVIAFARVHDSRVLMIVAPRFSFSMMDGKTELPLGSNWGDTALSIPERLHGTYKDLFTDNDLTLKGDLSVAEALSTFVTAALSRQ